MRELQYALRRLRGSPGFTIAATLTMAIAIGATASVFGVVDGVLLKAFPYREPDRVSTIWGGQRGAACAEVHGVARRLPRLPGTEPCVHCACRVGATLKQL